LYNHSDKQQNAFEFAAASRACTTPDFALPSKLTSFFINLTLVINLTLAVRRLQHGRRLPTAGVRQRV
jgi:uncharacterized membrane protein YhaH (DUF805 family)